MAYSLIAYRGGVIVDPSTLVGDGGQAQNDNDIELLSRTGTYHRAATDPTPNDDSANTSGNGVFYDLSHWINTAEWTTWVCQDATPTQARWVRLDAEGQPPGAPDRSLQFNDAGNFAGDANLTWASSALTIVGSLIATDARLNELLKFANWNNAAPSNSQIWSDASGNLSFFDAVHGQVATLSQVMAHVEPGAPVNSVQFNSAGSFGGSSALIWSGTRLELNAVSDNNAIIINGATTGYIRIDSTSTGTANIFSSNAWDLRGLNGNVTIQALGAGGNNVTTRCADRFIFQDQTVATRVSIYTTASPSIGRVVIAEDSNNAIVCGAGNELRIGYDGSNTLIRSTGGTRFDERIGINTNPHASAMLYAHAGNGQAIYALRTAANASPVAQIERTDPAETAPCLDVRSVAAASGHLQVWSHLGTPQAYVTHDGTMFAPDYKLTGPTAQLLPMDPMPGPAGEREAKAIEYTDAVVAYRFDASKKMGKWFSGQFMGNDLVLTGNIKIQILWIYPGSTTSTIEWGITAVVFKAGAAIPTPTQILSGPVTPANNIPQLTVLSVPFASLNITPGELQEVSAEVYRLGTGANDTLNADIFAFSLSAEFDALANL